MAEEVSNTREGGNDKDYKLSVIMPIYNVEDYVGEAIDSVLGQSIGRNENIEIILIDDGSVDGSVDICKSYAEQYPDRVSYVRKENGGVSSARNLGLAKARGKYIHFFDGDDLLSKDFYKKSIQFLVDNEHRIDFVAVKIKFFDEIIDPHMLNYKFTRSRVIDVTREPNTPVMHVSSCVFKAEIARQYVFDERLRITEDARFISQVLVRKKSYGVVTGPTFYYRRRSNKTSAIDSKYLRKDFYQETIDFAYYAMAEDWIDEKGHIDAYMQYVLLYDISYRLNQESQTVLTEQEVANYKQKIKKLVIKFDDEVIIGHNTLELYKKIYLLKWKYGDDFSSHITQDSTTCFFDNIPLVAYDTQQITIDFIHDIKNEQLLFEGYLDYDPVLATDNYQITCAGETGYIEFVERQQRQKAFLGDIIFSGGAFKTVLGGKSLRGSLSLSINDAPASPRTNTNRFTNLSNIEGCFTVRGDWVIRKVRQRLIIRRNSRARRLLYSTIFFVRLIAFLNLPKAREQYGKSKGRNLTQLSTKAKLFEIAKPFLVIAETIAYMPRAVLLRLLYYVYKAIKRNPIWLISDRVMAAGDNGEAFFRYAATQEEPIADLYFVISKKSKDYIRLHEYGNVVDQSSLRYKLLFLLSDKVISSHADMETTNPFLRQIDHYVDIFSFDFIFLQHGVTKDDVSSWLNRFEKNISLFVTSGYKEYQSILEGSYYYSEQEVVLTGMPRFDLLRSEPTGKLILAPTYRKHLARMKTNPSGQRRYDPSFKDSQYFTFYNDFMNDERILEALRKAGMKGEFYIHPNLEQQRGDFTTNDTFTAMEFPYDYTNAFREGNLLISDHSSVVFDFAYLKKPVIYAHFDIEQLFAGHSYKQGSFFSDEYDGFGPVYRDYEELVRGTVAAINNGCEMDSIYVNRVNNFFFKIDLNNCRRVYEAILSR